MKKSTFALIISGFIFFFSCDFNVVDGEDGLPQDQEQKDESEKEKNSERDCRDMIWDFVNYEIAITVTDKNGTDLLDSNYANSIPHDQIKIVYRDETYAIGDKTGATTRLCLPDWKGFRLVPYTQQPSQLMFGEFSPVANYEGEAVTLRLGDKAYHIIFSLYITYNDMSCPTVHRKMWLNGKLIPVESFRINIEI